MYSKDAPVYNRKSSASLTLTELTKPYPTEH